MASVSAGFTSLLLPETYGASLPQTLQQAEDFGKNERIFFAGMHFYDQNIISFFKD